MRRAVGSLSSCEEQRDTSQRSEACIVHLRIIFSAESPSMHKSLSAPSTFSIAQCSSQCFSRTESSIVQDSTAGRASCKDLHVQ